MGSCEPGAKSFSTSGHLWAQGGREAAGQPEEGRGRGASWGRGPPAGVHGGEGEGHALEKQDHEEPLTRRTVTHALAVLTRLAGEWRGVRAGSQPRNAAARLGETWPPTAKKLKRGQGCTSVGHGLTSGRWGPLTWSLRGGRAAELLRAWRLPAQGFGVGGNPGSGARPLNPYLQSLSRGQAPGHQAPKTVSCFLSDSPCQAGHLTALGSPGPGSPHSGITGLGTEGAARHSPPLLLH